MIKKVYLGKELAVIAESKPGILARVAQVLADRGIDIEAISAQAAGGVGLINVVVDDHLHAKDVLRKKGYSFKESDVLILEVDDKPGVLMGITKRLAAQKIDILNIYGSAPATYGPCVLVVATSNNAKALVSLRKK